MLLSVIQLITLVQGYHHLPPGPKETVKPSTPDEFRATIANNTYALVKFGSSLCPTTKSQQVDFETASHALKNEVPLIKIDVDDYRQIADEYHIIDFPEYRFFVNGQPTRYPGGFHNQTFIDWVRFMTSAPVIDARMESVPQYTTLYRPTVTVRASSVPPAFTSFASKHRSWALFTSDSSPLRSDGKIRISLVHDSFTEANDVSREAEKVIEFKDESEVTEAKIGEFMNKNRLPLVGVMNELTFKDYADYGSRGMVWVLLKPSEKRTVDAQRMKGYHTFAPIAQRVATMGYNFALVDFKQMENYVNKHFGIKDRDLPAMIVQPQNSDPSVYWRFEETFTADNLQLFIEKGERGLELQREDDSAGSKSHKEDDKEQDPTRRTQHEQEPEEETLEL